MNIRAKVFLRSDLGIPMEARNPAMGKNVKGTFCILYLWSLNQLPQLILKSVRENNTLIGVEFSRNAKKEKILIQPMISVTGDETNKLKLEYI